MKSIIVAGAALAAVGLTALSPTSATAEGAATLRGVVYGCGTSSPVGFAHVRLHELDGGTSYEIATDATGRFSRVGLAPGRWLIVASNDRPYRHYSVASRVALLESDDIVDMRIGTGMARSGARAALGAGRLAPGSETVAKLAYTQPVPICDEAKVPPATPTSDRYIIH